MAKRCKKDQVKWNGRCISVDQAQFRLEAIAENVDVLKNSEHEQLDIILEEMESHDYDFINQSMFKKAINLSRKVTKKLQKLKKKAPKNKMPNWM